MTKAQIIEELHQRGEWWANESYSKKELEKYLEGAKKAEEMTMEELLKHIKERKAK